MNKIRHWFIIGTIGKTETIMLIYAPKIRLQILHITETSKPNKELAWEKIHGPKDHICVLLSLGS
jgi:hypothetical protein